MKKLLIFSVILVAVGTLFYLWSEKMTNDEKREKLISFDSSSPRWEQVVNQFTPEELETVFTYVFDYVKKKRISKTPEKLKLKLKPISIKYNIFS